MPTNEHLKVKPEKLVAQAVGMLEQELVVPRLFLREGVDQYRGAEDDSINFKVEGVLPFRTYEWRGGSTTSTTPGTRPGITFDQYSERKFNITFGGNVYSAIKATDEQMDYDLPQWGEVMRPQAKAVARGLSRRCVDVLEAAPYAVTIGNAGVKLRGALIEARRVLNAFNVPKQNRYMLVGSNFEAALLEDDKLVLAQNVGDAEAESALREASLGRKFGFNFVTSEEIDPDAAYAFASSAFVMATAAPVVPQSAPFGATTAFEGYAMRWVRDYDSEHMQDRSVVNCYAGTRVIDDVLVGWDEANKTEVVSAAEHFVRGIRLWLDDSSDYPAPASELATITGISSASVWTPTGRRAETDPANA